MSRGRKVFYILQSLKVRSGGERKRISQTMWEDKTHIHDQRYNYMKRGYIVVLYSVYWQKQDIHRQKGYFIRMRIPQVFLDICQIKSSCTCLEDLHLKKILWIDPSSKSSLNNLKGGEEKQQRATFHFKWGDVLGQSWFH